MGFDDVLWKCPKHGHVPVLPSCTDGSHTRLLCTAPDPEMPSGLCDQVCTGPAVVAATGQVIGRTPVPGGPFNPRFEGAKKKPKRPGWSLPARKEDEMAKKSVLQPGTRNCEVCGQDLAGEHTRAKAHKACRTNATSAPRTRQDAETTGQATPAAGPPHARNGAAWRDAEAALVKLGYPKRLARERLAALDPAAFAAATADGIVKAALGNGLPRAPEPRTTPRPEPPVSPSLPSDEEPEVAVRSEPAEGAAKGLDPGREMPLMRRVQSHEERPRRGRRPDDDRAPSKLPPEARVDFTRLPVALSGAELARIDDLLGSGLWGKTRGGCVERIVSRFLQSLDQGRRR